MNQATDSLLPAEEGKPHILPAPTTKGLGFGPRGLGISRSLVGSA